MEKRRRKRRNKGSPYEREICRTLTAWWTGDPDLDVVFWRTAGSGGRATVRGRRGQKTHAAHCGDLAALEPDAEHLTRVVTFEIKRGYTATAKRATLADLLDKPRGLLKQEGFEEWVEQAERSAAAAGTPFWAIIHRRDNRDAYIAFPMSLYDVLGEEVAFAGPLLMFWGSLRRGTGAKQRTAFVSVTLNAFLSAVSPTLIRRLSRRRTP